MTFYEKMKIIFFKITKHFPQCMKVIKKHFSRKAHEKLNGNVAIECNTNESDYHVTTENTENNTFKHDLEQYVSSQNINTPTLDEYDICFSCKLKIDLSKQRETNCCNRCGIKNPGIHYVKCCNNIIPRLSKCSHCLSFQKACRQCFSLVPDFKQRLMKFTSHYDHQINENDGLGLAQINPDGTLFHCIICKKCPTCSCEFPYLNDNEYIEYVGIVLQKKTDFEEKEREEKRKKKLLHKKKQAFQQVITDSSEIEYLKTGQILNPSDINDKRMAAINTHTNEFCYSTSRDIDDEDFRFQILYSMMSKQQKQIEVLTQTLKTLTDMVEFAPDPNSEGFQNAQADFLENANKQL